MINAQSGSGKTNLLANLLRKEFYGDYFAPDHVHVFSNSLFTDPLWDLLPDETLAESEDCLDKDILESIVAEATADVEKEGKTKANARLIIADDCIMEIYNRGKPDIMEKFYIRLRHVNCSIVITAQEYMLLPKPIRINTTGLILFKINNMKEILAIWREHGGLLDRYTFMSILADVWKKPYSFLFLDFTQPFGEHMRREFGPYIPLPKNFFLPQSDQNTNERVAKRQKKKK